MSCGTEIFKKKENKKENKKQEFSSTNNALTGFNYFGDRWVIRNGINAKTSLIQKN